MIDIKIGMFLFFQKTQTNFFKRWERLPEYDIWQMM